MLELGSVSGNIILPDRVDSADKPLRYSGFSDHVSNRIFHRKIPGVDSIWDAAHTFVRVPAGAMLAASMVGDVSPALEIYSKYSWGWSSSD